MNRRIPINSIDRCGGTMSRRLKFERFFRFHNRIKPGAYPNTWHLEEKFEIHTRTIQPFYLMRYMCSWRHPLVRYSTHRQEVLDSSIAHIKTIIPAEETIRLPADLRSIKN